MHLDGEDRGVVGAAARHRFIPRRRQATGLRPFLQSGLGVAGVFLDGLDALAPEPQHELACHFEARVEVHGGDHRLHRVAKQRLLAAAARHHLGAAELQYRAEVDLAGDIGAGFLAHQRVEARRKLAFRGVAVGLEQRLGDAEPEHAVAQELEPLVVGARGRADRAVGERANEKLGLREAVPEPVHECLDVGADLHALTSVDRLEEPIRTPGPEVEERLARRGEHHPVGAADQVFRRHEAKPAGSGREAAVLGVVAVVAHEEILALGHGEDRGVVGHPIVRDVQDVVADPVRQGLGLARLQAGAADPHRVVFAARHQLLRALRRLHLGEGAGIGELHRRAVDVQHALHHLDLVAGQADQPLDEVDVLRRVTEDDDIAAFGLAREDPAGDRAGGERAGMARIAVGHLVDEEEVADQQRVLHRARGNPERLEEQGAEHPRDHQCPDDGFHRLDDAAFGFLGHSLPRL
ncbi:hypothetical protein SDC9_34783 [bioreactor metagenome]|uniref:Uncharacterized protein n=1 Tax=bioreactor metagenome TaxID=1076179 RepID=A0A644VBP1_9ZZZZ